MTAKIKLNAASGGGSFSLQAPSSSNNNRVLTLPDAADGIVAQTDNSGNFSVSGTTTCTGNLKAGTITDTSGNNSSTTAQIAKGRCKAWVFFNDSGTIFQSSSTDQSFNVSSVNDVGSSEYHINFASAFPDANYMPVVQCSQNDDGRCAISASQQNSSTVCKLFTRNDFTGSRSDASNNMVTIWSVV